MNVRLAAWKWYLNGFCAIPVRSDGSKAPGLTHWRELQSRLPNGTELANWFGSGVERSGYGLLMGSVSGNAEMLEFEGRAVHLMPEFLVRCNEAGCGDVARTVLAGYREETPSGGVHLIFRVSDGPALPNTKLAADPNGQCMIETRGEGGFVVTAPSNGTTHPSGGAWVLRSGTYGEVPVITCAQRDALYAVARSFDETPEALRPTSRPISDPSNPFSDHYDGGGLSPLDHFRAEASWADILEPQGWEWVRRGAGGEDYWLRPGKRDEGGDARFSVSATTGRADDGDRLYIFSTSTTLPAETPHNKDYVYAHYNHGGDMKAAAHALHAQGWGDRSWGTKRTTERSDGYSPMTVPPEFWESRPELRHIRDAAWAEDVMPEAALAHVLANLVAHVSPSVVLTNKKGEKRGGSALGLYFAVAGASGAGKSDASACAQEMLDVRRAGLVGGNAFSQEHPPVEIGDTPTRQGLTTLFQADAARGERFGPRTGYLALLDIDEGATLRDNAKMEQANPIPALCAAWTAARIGATNKGATRSRLERSSYRLSMVMNIQPKNAEWLLDRSAGDTGLTQRVLWALAYLHPDRPTPENIDHPHPGKLTVVLPEECSLVFDPERALRSGGGTDWMPAEGLVYMEPCAAELEALREERLFRVGGGLPEEFQEHALWNRRRVAAALCLLGGRMSVSDEDFELAGMFMAAHEEVRRWVLGELAKSNAEAAQERAVAAGRADFARSEAAAAKRCAQADADREILLSLIREHDKGDGVTCRSMRGKLNNRLRQRSYFDEMVADLVEDGVLVEREWTGMGRPTKRWSLAEDAE